MDKYDTLIKEVTYAFHDQRVVALVGEICGIDACHAGGISSMAEQQFL